MLWKRGGSLENWEITLAHLALPARALLLCPGRSSPSTPLTLLDGRSLEALEIWLVGAWTGDARLREPCEDEWFKGMSTPDAGFA